MENVKHMYVGKITRTIKRYAVVAVKFVKNENGTYSKETELIGIIVVCGKSVPKDSFIRKNFEIPREVKFELVEESEAVYEAHFEDVAPFFEVKIGEDVSNFEEVNE